MNIREFHELPQYQYMTEATGLLVGSKFLHGAKIIDQVNNKSVGDMVTYYQVFTVLKNGNISYGERMERLTGIQEDKQ